MLISLLYVSQPTGPVTTAVTSTILRSSNLHNKAAEITGILCQGSGIYMQALEGERSKVNNLFYQIIKDTRHHNIELLCLEEITHRRFDKWSMALVHLNQNDPMVKMKHPEFDPYSSTARDAMNILNDLVNTSSPILPID